MRASSEQAERLHRFAHDLRNRLSGMHEVLKHLATTPGEDSDEMLEFGERQFFQALREVESLLDDLGVDRMVKGLRSEEIGMPALVREAVGRMGHRFERKEQALDLELSDDVVALGDGHYVMELVTALLSNASKFSPSGSTIRVVLKKDGGEARLDVADQGVGLSASDLNDIFVRFAWLESRSTDNEAQGRGTLARARQWAQAMGGSLHAKSAGSGNGSVFTLRLPLA